MTFRQGLKKEILNTLLFCMTSSPHRKACLVQKQGVGHVEQGGTVLPLAVRNDQFPKRETKSLFVASIVDTGWTTMA